MYLAGILKIILFSFIVICFIFSIGFITACKQDEIIEEASSSAEDAGESAEVEIGGESTGESEEEGMVQEAGEESPGEVTGYLDIGPEEAKELIEEKPDLIIIDVSTVYEDGHIPGAVNYYVGDGALDAAIPSLDIEGKYLVYCHSDNASILGAQKLIDSGFKNVYRLKGNFSAWVDAGYEVEVGKGGETEAEIMKIESFSFKNNEMIPPDYTCDGTNINPSINISGVPGDAVSLVLIMDDPDAPGGTWVHWTVWNIDPETERIYEDTVPDGSVEGVTDFGKPGYGGPCPPSGTHRYFFKLYALDIMLDLDNSATAEDIMETVEGHILDSAELIGLYESNK